ncbi:protoheme IX farnesyltransferase [Sinomonas cellulolyticus]|jgi:protoheme IX farnesyltransferase|uniref:Protoheme IX farnesyltransferase n=1 Tax=Sinomonas cellulolyticus TaxID=2801916 RepID=A0ABS1K110_9MICC|nr:MULTISPECIES: heme o synthase [Sinomonas]MBL0705351.1 protoheme IX farnesyltransferase [Sinomonas cellulolyticus]GHG40691.1 protoheme IX farnesyltransferase [Sinomonas sp. KCTC 49339]
MSTADAPVAVPSRPAKLGLRRKVKAYVALTKPRIIELLLVSTLPTMIYAERGFPSIGLMLATLVGGAFAAGSAGSFNCYIDRDIDRLMRRTENRPLVTGEVTPREALVFSWVLGIASLAILWFGANPLSAVLGAAAIFFYVVIYTLILKRRTTQNIVWGGAAGCFPVLIAWSAVTNTIGWPAVILFLVIFLWTPPHYWPLSMRYGEDYRNAHVPMLGAVAGAKIVSVQVVLYAWAMVIASLLMVPLGHAGWVYTIAAVAVGGWFLYESHALYSRAQREEIQDKKAMKVFHGSISYLTVLFLALAVDPFVGSPLFG